MEEVKPGWMLIWCHENCFKQPCADLHKNLNQYVKDNGGSFKCFRKARQFLDWSHSPKATKKYVLLTDWREVKQCVATKDHTCSSVKRPVSTFVHCADDKQRRRVQLWADGLPKSVGKIHLGGSSAELELLGVLKETFQLHGVLGDRAAPGDHGTQVHELSPLPCTEPADVHVEGASVSETQPPSQIIDGAHARCVLQKDVGRQPPQFFPLCQPSDRLQGLQAFQPFVYVKYDEKVAPMLQAKRSDVTAAELMCDQATSSMATSSNNVTPRVAAQFWMSSQSRAQLEQALRDAMPDYYED